MANQVYRANGHAAQGEIGIGGPRPLVPDPSGIPAELKAIARWVCYRKLSRDNKPTKVPFRARNPKKEASSTDSRTWGTFDEAHAAYLDPANRLDGVGFVVVEDPDGGVDIVGGDLDGCIRADGTLEDWAQEIVDALPGYWEKTPGGSGLRGWWRGRLPAGRRKKALGPKKAIEFYSSGRYLTATGLPWAGSVPAIVDRTAELIELHGRIFAKKAKPDAAPQPAPDLTLDDSALLDKARSCKKTGDDFSALWRGDLSAHKGDASAGDYHLLRHLAFWTNRDAGRMETLFNGSELAKRGKWGRADYRARTIEAAIAATNNGYVPPSPKGEANGHHHANGTAGSEAATRPKILITTRENEVIDQAVAAFDDEKTIYQRGNLLVMILRDVSRRKKDLNRPAGSARVSLMPPARLRELLAKNAAWTKRRKMPDGSAVDFAAHPPTWAIAGVAARGEWPNIRHIEGVVECPTMRPDGSILSVKGWDEETGLVYQPGATFPALPTRPTKEDAAAAASRLFSLVGNFPFAKPHHRAAWLAALLTALARFAIQGPTPLFLFDANCPGTGKSKLCDIIAIVVSGREMPRSGYPDDETEMAKQILSIALAADLMVLFDNVPTGFSVGGASIDRALTARTVKGRILGRSEMTADLPWNTVVFATGNNLGLRGDALRRVVPSRLESPEERPEERKDFAIKGDLLNHVRQERGRLVVDALTILMGYVAAGKPDQDLTPMDYRAWSDLIRNAVHWATGIDPCEARKELRANDSDTNEAMALVRGWRRLCEFKGVKALTSGDALQALRDGAATAADDEIKGLREILCGWSKTDDLPGSRIVGNRLNKLRGRVYGGIFLESIPARAGFTAWSARTAAGDSGDSGDSVPYLPALELGEGGVRSKKAGDSQKTHQTHQTHHDVDGREVGEL